MRFGKKPNIAENKKTRSCVVLLEKVLQHSNTPPPNPSSSGRTLPSVASVSVQRNRRHTLATGSIMGATPKHSLATAPAVKKRVDKLQTPQQRQNPNSINMSSTLRSNQKIKSIPRSNKSAVQISAATSGGRDETPPPTIAAGRSRRAIKPNPKYASEDMVTPKMVRNVGMSKTMPANDAKQRKTSTSSDDFYNNSDDDYDDSSKKTTSKYNDMDSDKAYKVNEKEEAIALDSDISEIEEELVAARSPRMRGRPRKTEASGTHNIPKITSQPTNSNNKRSSNATVLPIRTAPTQLQQLRRSLASANALRNQNLLSGSGNIAQKRKLDESLDSDDSDTSYTVARKQMMVSNSAGTKIRVPIRENSIITSSTPLNKRRESYAIKGGNSTNSTQSLNGRSIGSSQIIERRRIMESSKASLNLPAKTIVKTPFSDNKVHQMSSGRPSKTQVLASKPPVAASSATVKTNVGNNAIDANKNRLRTSSPRPSMPRETLSSSAKSLVAHPPGSSAFSSQQQKKLPILPSRAVNKSNTANNPPLKSSFNTKGKPSPHQQNSNNIKTSSTSPAISVKQSVAVNDESPNSTIDDFETMPTFTIVNVNDIINKKGDVLITKSKTPPDTIIEFSESISLDEDDEVDDGGKVKRKKVNATPPVTSNKMPSLSNSRLDHNRSKAATAGPRNSMEQLKKNSTGSASAAPVAKAPQILNHKLGLRNNQRVAAKTTQPVKTPPVPEKPAPRILNSVVAKRTEPVKPLIANLDDSADESFPLSLDEEEDTDDEQSSKTLEKIQKKSQSYSLHLDADDTESQNTEADEPLKVTPKALAPKNNSTVNTALPVSPQRKRRPAIATPIVVSNKKRILTPTAAKENSLAATNQQTNESKSSSIVQQVRKPPAEKVVISRQGDKIIKKITCFETWYVINMPMEPKRQSIIRNQLDMPLIRLANNARTIPLPSDLWSCKVTLYELSAMTLAKSTLVTYTGDLTEYNISEEDRAKYQPSCVMFRRSIENRQLSRMPYDRAVIFKNKTFSTNIEGKNVRLVGAPSVINSEREIEILLEVVDALSLQSEFVENASPQQ